MHNQYADRQMKKYFTLIELLVVIAIIAILAAILMPALSQARERGKSATCLNNEKQISLANANYMSDFNDWFHPTYFSTTATPADSPVDGFIGNPVNGGNNAGNCYWPYRMGSASLRSKQLKYISADLNSAKSPFVCPSDTDPRGQTSEESLANTVYYSYAVNTMIAGEYYKVPQEGVWFTASTFKHHLVKKRPSQIAHYADCSDQRAGDTGRKAAKFCYVNKSSKLDPAEIESWIDIARSPGFMGARHNLRINVAFADGHCKAIPVPIANSHTSSKQYMYWASPFHIDRTDLN